MQEEQNETKRLSTVIDERNERRLLMANMYLWLRQQDAREVMRMAIF